MPHFGWPWRTAVHSSTLKYSTGIHKNVGVAPYLCVVLGSISVGHNTAVFYSTIKYPTGIQETNQSLHISVFLDNSTQNNTWQQQQLAVVAVADWMHSFIFSLGLHPLAIQSICIPRKQRKFSKIPLSTYAFLFPQMRLEGANCVSSIVYH